ncbi:MAG: FHA domain-containing protein [Verrucomicrobia bacterium]|nr:FHA domain-containing protein [Verrucomicrobiota bacterium]
MAKLHLLPVLPDSEPFELLETMVLIGRKPDNTLQVEDGNVSKYHALLAKTEEGYRIFDLHSANGTFVNDERITTVLIKNNDTLRIGPAVFQFEADPVVTAALAPGVKPKIRLGARLGAKPLGQQPEAATAIPVPPAAEATVISPPSTPSPEPIRVSIPVVVTEAAPPLVATIVTTTAIPVQAVPVAEAATDEADDEQEPLVSIRIPEEKKSILAPPPPTDATPAEPEAAPKPHLGFGLKRVAAPTPEPPPPTADVEPPPPPATAELEPTQPPTAERSLRPKLGGGAGGGTRLKLRK